jgi:hypothetical protein
MSPLSSADLLSAAEYDRQREAMRRRVMMLKDRRRVVVGDHCSVHFECRETLRYQILEMLRVEHSWNRPAAVIDELLAYNPLLPGGGDLSATVMFEYETPEERATMLTALTGIERHLWLTVGDTPRIPAQFDGRQMTGTKVSAVQFVRWRLDDQQRAALKTEGTVLRILIDHPAYSTQSVLSEQTRKEIAGDPEAET